ncbi:MAG TPA: hypothetical protein VL137_05470 [Polyangiaceae bacterium]|nr:hypothetical protein [Polyangiaceae bacterium]
MPRPQDRRKPPAEFVVPTQIVVDESSARRVSKLVSSPRKPTAKLRTLMRKG